MVVENYTPWIHETLLIPQRGDEIMINVGVDNVDVECTCEDLMNDILDMIYVTDMKNNAFRDRGKGRLYIQHNALSGEA
jgi:hypothetical protein